MEKIAKEETKVLSKEKIFECDRILSTNKKLSTSKFREESQIFNDAINNLKVESPEVEFCETIENSGL